MSSIDFVVLAKSLRGNVPLDEKNIQSTTFANTKSNPTGPFGQRPWLPEHAALNFCRPYGGVEAALLGLFQSARLHELVLDYACCRCDFKVSTVKDTGEAHRHSTRSHLDARAREIYLTCCPYGAMYFPTQEEALCHWQECGKTQTTAIRINSPRVPPFSAVVMSQSKMNEAHVVYRHLRTSEPYTIKVCKHEAISLQSLLGIICETLIQKAKFLDFPYALHRDEAYEPAHQLVLVNFFVPDDDQITISDAKALTQRYGLLAELEDVWRCCAKLLGERMLTCSDCYRPLSRDTRVVFNHQEICPEAKAKFTIWPFAATIAYFGMYAVCHLILGIFGGWITSDTASRRKMVGQVIEYDEQHCT